MIPYTTYMDLSQQKAVEDLILKEVRDVNQQLPEVMKSGNLFCFTNCWTRTMMS